ncbi:unnamed protein product [Didymodactylos carnosus]|uniref:SHSP domain-containing protein n=1 Tax=Didymodactylos carnosus TaxID=1234261 RepID=A0A815JQ89_9BILA|nr:unnamed protein product [Didymodactylos carnosus]CAF1382060.1 unnamed protein product [Didymodactylos carnosus]CAF3875551.1 unnamed protein product [Didymodactylos carnosus]CAF4277389.1 unnamed protein product [Didymodactylos carnosus]
MSSLIPVHRFSRHDPFHDVVDFFHTNLDWYDPFDDFDQQLTVFPTNRLRWLNEPPRQRPSYNRGQSVEKFRVQLDVTNFDHNSIHTKIDGQKLIVTGKQEEKSGDDYVKNEFRKAYDLPEHVDTKDLVSYITPNDMLVIEIPIKNPQLQQNMLESQKQYQNSEKHVSSPIGGQLVPSFDFGSFYGGTFGPKIVDDTTSNTGKKLNMNVDMKGYKPEQIKVSVKDNELIVQGEQEYESNNRAGRSYFYKQVTLPPGVITDRLQTHLMNNGQLTIEAPYAEPRQPQAIESAKKT